MTKTTRICNMCSKEIEHYNDFNVGYRFGYESCYDGDIFELDLCGNCLDKFTKDLMDNCEINPVSETE